MKRILQAAIALVFFFAIQSAWAQSVWELDPPHSEALFKVKHMMVSNVTGQFGKMSCKLTFDGRTTRLSRPKLRSTSPQSTPASRSVTSICGVQIFLMRPNIP
jgi:polyisoprenoid-binding protein YceI